MGGVQPSLHLYTRGDQKVRGKKLPFLHSLIDRAGITAHNTATHMHLIGYNMFDVSRLLALQMSSRQRFLARTGPFYTLHCDVLLDNQLNFNVFFFNFVML